MRSIRTPPGTTEDTPQTSSTTSGPSGGDASRTAATSLSSPIALTSNVRSAPNRSAVRRRAGTASSPITRAAPRDFAMAQP